MMNKIANITLRHKILLFLLSLFGFMIAPFAQALATGEDHGQIFYISPNGNDQNTGQIDAPLRSAHRAQQLAMPYFGKQKVDFIFMDGIHHLDSTLVINTAQTGTSSCPVTYRAQNRGKAIISGSKELSLNWQSWNDTIYVAEVPDSVPYIDQLIVNGKPAVLARYPNRTGKRIFDCWDLDEPLKTDSLLDVFHPLRIASWKNPQGAYVHAMYSQMWGDLHWKVNGKEGNELTFEGGDYDQHFSIMHPVFRYIENVFEELDCPGEWFYEADTRQLFYYPQPGEDLQNTSFEEVRLQELIRMEGYSSQPISDTNISGLIFRHTARTFMEPQEPLLRSDLSICRKAAVNLDGTRQCRIEYCEFDAVGGNAICVNRYNRELLIYGCYIHDNGANGIAFIGSPSAVRTPLFAYDTPDYKLMDRLPGPKNNIYPGNCRVEDCLITRTGRIEKQTAPILISMSHAITINHCSIYETPRSGICISDGTFGGHVIEYCDIFDTVLETSELGSFSSWGRDRYWSPMVDQTVEEVLKDPLLPTLDIVAPNVLRNNRWSCDRGFAINIDEGSSCYQITNNILLNGGIKLHSGYNRTVTNNIIINNTLHPQLWYSDSKDIFKGNIVFKPYEPKAMQAYMSDSTKWGKEIDYNFFATNDSTILRYTQNHCDLHSLLGTPQFQDAATGNYRISPNSPAAKMGFHNFNMRSIGVMLPLWRNIAKTPRIPQLIIQEETIKPSENEESEEAEDF